MELGQLYRSSEVIGAGQDLPHARTPEAWAGQPGVRAPHAWIIYQGETISTIDLFTGGFVLLSSNPAWREPAKDASDRVWGFHTGRHRRRRCPVPECGEFERLFGVQSGGASLVRPDGVVCWRTEPTLRLGVCSQVQQSVVPWRSRRTESVGKNPSRD